MKTFFIVTFYTVMVAALDLGGAVWTSLRTVHPSKAAIVITAPAKTVNAVRAPATIPSNT